METRSRLYQLVEKRLDGTLADYVAARRGTKSWRAIAEELSATTDIQVSDEALRRWFADRLVIEVKVSDTPIAGAA